MISLKDINITTEMLGIISQIDEFKGSWNAIARTPEKLQSLKKVATIESIGSSNRIEGNILSDKQVETILSNIKKQSFTTRDEQEVVGYADLMENIFDNYEVVVDGEYGFITQEMTEADFAECVEKISCISRIRLA